MRRCEGDFKGREPAGTASPPMFTHITLLKLATRVRERELENEFLKNAAAFFAKNLLATDKFRTTCLSERRRQHKRQIFRGHDVPGALV